MHEAPTTIGKYQLTDLLGQGAMGVVYRALDPALGRYVAIKLMGQSLASDSQLRDRFMREARAAGSLQHPNIITIFDFGEVEGHLYIAMEYIEGADLSEIMERRDPLTLPAKLDIIIDVLHALAYAHDRKVIHRDIKPANIRVGTDGRAKLMDFGIARLDASSELTKTGMLIGTPNYMAPEQVNSQAITPATDIFSLGSVLYEFISNQKSFAGDTLHSVLFKVVGEHPTPLLEIVPGLPPALDAIVRKALAKPPADRYQHAGVMAQDLAAVRTALSGGGHVTIAARRTPLGMSGVGLPAPAASPATPAAAPSRRRLLAVAIAAGLVVVSLGGYVVLQRRTPPAARMADSLRMDSMRAPAAAPVTSSPAPAPNPSPTTAPRAPVVAPRPAPTASAPPPAAAPGSTVTEARPVTTPPSVPPGTPVAPAVVPQAPPTATPTAAPSPTPATTPPLPVPPAPAEPAIDPRPEIERLVASYGRAIESRNVAEIKRWYPGMTPEQQSAWQQFFQMVRTVRARLSIARMDLGEGTADLAVTGSYDYDAGTGRVEQRPANFRATAALENGAWRLRSVR